MKNARVLRRELELWKVTWQQVETFLQQIDGAAGKDGSQRRRMEALLLVARALEHESARAAPGAALGDPVITTLPRNAYLPAEKRTEGIGDAWADTNRRWRLPGADEVELAVGLLTVTDEGKIADAETVTLPAVVPVFQQRDGTGALTTLRLPSYPGSNGVTIRDGLGPAPSVKEDTGRISLFSKQARAKATQPPVGQSTDESPVSKWSALCTARRSARSSASSGNPVRLSSNRPGAPWGAELATSLSAVESLASGAAVAPASGTLTQLRTAVAASVAAVQPDTADLVAGAKGVDDEGLSNSSLAAAIAAAAAAAAARLAALAALDSAAATLLSSPESASGRTALANALSALRAAVLPDMLLRAPIEQAGGGLSALAQELDGVVSARVEYPDGTLRSLRTLEAGFVVAWPHLRRWFVLRHRAVLAPALATFRTPFVAGLLALLRGGFTGLPVEGLALGATAAVGAATLDLQHPASMVAVLAGALEPGHVGVLGGERPAPVVVLGVEDRLGHAVLDVAPLQLSTASPAAAPGPAGTVPPGTPIGYTAPRPLSAREFRRGRSDDGPGQDALVRGTLNLYGRLGLVFGTDVVERLLQGLATDAAVPTRLIPDPSPTPPPLFGTVPGYATTLVVHGLGAAFWALPGSDGVPADAPVAEPRLVRPGDVVLLRGRVAGDGGAPGPLVQAPVEVDDVYGAAGSILSQLDTSRAGVLSTSAAAIPPPPSDSAEPSAPAPAGSARPSGDPRAGQPSLICAPQDPLTIVLLKQSWQREALLSEVSLVRRFAGFDAPSLAARTLLPLDLVAVMLGGSPPDVPGVGRGPEFSAALDTLDAWTRYGNDQR